MTWAMMGTRAFAERLGVVPETIRRWVRDGRLIPAGRTPTGQLRFREDQVEQALATHEGSIGLNAPALTERAQDIEAHLLAQRDAARARLRLLRQAQ